MKSHLIRNLKKFKTITEMTYFYKKNCLQDITF